MKTNKLSIKAAIIATAGVAILIGIVYVANLSNKGFEKTVVSQTQQELSTIAKAIATNLEESIVWYSKALTVVSNNPLLQKNVYEKKGCVEIEAQFCPIKNHYEAHKKDVDAITLSDADGIMLHREPYIKGRVGIDLTDKPGVAYVIRDHKSHVSEVFYNNLGNLAISILEPIFYKDKFAGIVRWMIETDTIARRFVEPVKVGKKGFVWMFDNRNIIISHPRKDFIGMTVLDVIKKMHDERSELFDESRTQEHIIEEHDYLNRVKVEEAGCGIFINCVTDEHDIIVYKRVAAGDLLLNLVVSLPYSEIADPINKHAREIFGLAGFVIILLGAGGFVLLKNQKEKDRLETEARYLKQISNGAEALRKSEERFKTLVANIPGVTYRCAYDSDWTSEYISDEIRNISGYPASDFMNRVRSYASIIYPDDIKVVENAIDDGVKKKNPFTINYRIVRADGDVRHVYERGQAVFDDHGEVAWLDGAVFDITAQKLAEEALQKSEERFREFVEGTDDLATRVDSKGRLLYVNDTSKKIFGLSPEECIGLSAFDFIHPDDREKTKAAFAEWIRDRVPNATFENQQVSRTGQVHYMHWTINPHFDKDGNLTAINSIASDFTDLKLAEDALAAEMDRRMEFSKQLEEANAQLKRLTLIDGLTGIANRWHFDEFLEKEWHRNMRDNNPVSLIMGDIDFFKNYNDTYGHQEGDDCLKQIAAILSNIAKRPGDLAARYGGEEFAVILSGTDLKQAGVLAEKAHKKLSNIRIPHSDSQAADYVTLSIGVASIIPKYGTKPYDLIKAADKALYKAKNSGRNQVCDS